MGLFKYVIGGIAGGLLGAGTGIAGFGAAISGIGPGIAIGLLTIKAFSGNGQPIDDAGRERVRAALDGFKSNLEPPNKKLPSKRHPRSATAKTVAPKTVAPKTPAGTRRNTKKVDS